MEQFSLLSGVLVDTFSNASMLSRVAHTGGAWSSILGVAPSYSTFLLTPAFLVHRPAVEALLGILSILALVTLTAFLVVTAAPSKPSKQQPRAAESLPVDDDITEKRPVVRRP